MKFSLSWLKDHLDTTADIKQVAEAMTMAGLEVEEVHDTMHLLAPFTVAKVISAQPHPNADRLQVLQVDTVDGLKEIVCGAPNARAGMTTIYAPIGAFVPGLNVTLVEKPVRGVVSNGMMCSAAELNLSDEHDGILDLNSDLLVGTAAVDVFGIDPVIDFEVTPNRPDWLGVHGIARDLAATGLGKLLEQPIAPIISQYACPIAVEINEEACPIFAGRVIRGVTNGPSPEWLQAKLKSIGMKPISALVDVTNYLSIDRARPLHVYDVSKLSGSVLKADLPPEEQDLLALDGKTYRVTPNMCAIRDQSGVIGLGGIMGGDSTKVDEHTVDIFIECAWFDPIRTAQTGRDTKISSDAQYRFARGVDPQFVIPGLDLATRLILDLCGGEPSDRVVTGATPEGRPDISFDPAFVSQLTALDVSDSDTQSILTALGFKVTTGDLWNVSVPSWRRDVEGKADLVEEVARIYGFNKIPATALPSIGLRSRGVLTPPQARARVARRALATYGYSEAVTWSFMRQDWASLFGGGDDGLVLANPIASELNCMRPSALPNLLEAAGRNAARGYDGARLFEIGPIYLGLEPGDQKLTITAVQAPSSARGWQPTGEDRLFALKSDLMRLLEDLGAPLGALQLVQGQNSSHWHPGRSARLQLGPKSIVAEFGELHPSVLKALDLDGNYIAFDLRVDQLPAPKVKSSKSRGALNLSNLMPLRRDFAFVVPANVSAGDLVRAVKTADKSLISDVQIFDVYKGVGVPPDHASLAVEVTLVPADKTLTEPEIEAISAKIITSASKIGAILRR